MKEAIQLQAEREDYSVFYWYLVWTIRYLMSIDSKKYNSVVIGF